MPRSIWLSIPLVLALALGASAQTATPSSATGPAASTASPLDINSAVNAYFAKMPPARRAQSDAYFEGGYWMILWDFLVSAFVMWLLLHFRWSAKMRNLAERITRFRSLQTAIYCGVPAANSAFHVFERVLDETE